MPYVVYARYGTKPQNKLQQAIADLVMKQDRLLLTELEAEKFKDDLLQHIAGLNDKHKTAKPVQSYWWAPADFEDWLNGTGKPSAHDLLLGFEHGGSGFVNCTLLYCYDLNNSDKDNHVSHLNKCIEEQKGMIHMLQNELKKLHGHPTKSV